MPPSSQPPSRPPRPGAARGVGPSGAARARGTAGPGAGAARPGAPAQGAARTPARPSRPVSTPAPARRAARPVHDDDDDVRGRGPSDAVDLLTQHCFNAIIALRHIDAGAARDPERVQRHFRKLISSMIQDAPGMGIPHDDAQEMAYAIVALADEVALSGPAQLSQPWMGNLLQMHFFDENAAGEGFFDHLDQARASRRYDVLKVYYTCLMLGFVGRHAMHGGETELAEITASVHDALLRDDLRAPESLSPRGERPKEALTAEPRALRLMWIPIGAVAVAAALYIALAATVAHKASAVVELLESLVH